MEFFLFLGLLLYLVGSLWLVVVEFKESILWGLLGLFLQITHIIFIILHFGKCVKPLACMLLGILLIAMGVLTQA